MGQGRRAGEEEIATVLCDAKHVWTVAVDVVEVIGGVTQSRRANLGAVDEGDVFAVAEQKGDRAVLLLARESSRVPWVAIVKGDTRSWAVDVAKDWVAIVSVWLPVGIGRSPKVVVADAVAAAIPAVGKPRNPGDAARRSLRAGALASGPGGFGVSEVSSAVLG